MNGDDDDDDNDDDDNDNDDYDNDDDEYDCNEYDDMVISSYLENQLNVNRYNTIR